MNNNLLKLVQGIKDAEGLSLGAVIQKVEQIKASDLKTKADVKQVAQALVQLKKVVNDIPLDNEVKKLQKAISDATERVSASLSKEVEGVRTDLRKTEVKLRQEIDDKIPDVVTITERVNEIEKALTDDDYARVLEKVRKDEEVAFAVRDYIESWEGDNRLDASKLKNLPEMKTLNAGGGSNVSIFSNGTFVGSSTRINFTGATVTNEGGRLKVAVTGGGSVSDEAYGGTWDGVTDEAPSKNAVYDKIQSLVLDAGAGDVVGPTSAVNNRIALFDGTTGKLIKDSGSVVGDFATSAQGGLADTALQNVVEDTTPQLGGNLDAQNNQINNVSLLEISDGVNHPYHIDIGSNQGLHIHGQDAGSPVTLDLATADQDGTDNVRMKFFAVGDDGSTNNERMSIGYEAASTRFSIATNNSGTGTLRPLHLYTDSDTDQLVLNTDGTVDIQGNQVLDAGDIGVTVAPALGADDN